MLSGFDADGLTRWILTWEVVGNKCWCTDTASRRERRVPTREQVRSVEGSLGTNREDMTLNLGSHLNSTTHHCRETGAATREHAVQRVQQWSDQTEDDRCQIIRRGHPRIIDSQRCSQRVWNGQTAAVERLRRQECVEPRRDTISCRSAQGV